MILGLSLLWACESGPTDEQLREDLHGTWLPNLIRSEEHHFTPEQDSSLFFQNGRRRKLTVTVDEVRFTQFQAEQFPYEVKDGHLSIQFTSDTSVTNHTINYKIEHLSYKKLVLFFDGKKLYYERLIY